MARKKEWIGIILLVIALAGFGVWEKWGRDYYMTQPVIVANEEIPAGTILSPAQFHRENVENKSVMDGAITPEGIDKIRNKRAIVTIPKNAQLSEYQLRDCSYYLAEGQSIYVLKGEWIALRSSSLRRGDWIDLYSIPLYEEKEDKASVKKPEDDPPDAEEQPVLGEFLGSYRVSFVKDSNECEVMNTDASTSSEFDYSDVLSRGSSTAPIYQVEIIATAEEYAGILKAIRKAEEYAEEEYGTVRNRDAASLLLVQTFKDGENA